VINRGKLLFALLNPQIQKCYYFRVRYIFRPLIPSLILLFLAPAEAIPPLKDKSASRTARKKPYTYIQVPLYHTDKIEDMFYKNLGSRTKILRGSPNIVRDHWNPIKKEIELDQDFFKNYYLDQGWIEVSISNEMPEFLKDVRNKLLAKEGRNIDLSKLKFINVPFGLFKRERTGAYRRLPPEFIKFAMQIFANLRSEDTNIVQGFSKSFFRQHPEFGQEKEVQELWASFTAAMHRKQWTYSETFTELIERLHKKYPHTGK